MSKVSQHKSRYVKMVRLTLIDYVFQRIMLASVAIFLTCYAITNTHSTSVINSNKCNSRCDDAVTIT